MRNKQAYNLLQIEEDEDGRGQMVKEFGKNLRRLRTAKGLTQQELGGLSNVAYKYIGEIERGEKNPTVVIIFKLAHALGVNVSEILTIEECSSAEVDMLKEVERLFEGREERDVQKAVRILEVFFE